MASGTSLGWGIALRSGNRKDYVSKIADNYVKQQAARAKASNDKAKEANKAFKDGLGKLAVDPNAKYVPMYLTAISEKAMDNINKLTQMKVSGATSDQIYTAASEMQLGMMQLYGANSRAYAAVTDDKNFVSDQFRIDMMDRNKKFADMAKYVNNFAGISIDPETGDFNYVPYENKLEVPVLDYDKTDELVEGDPKDVRKKFGTTYRRLARSYVSDEALATAASTVLGNQKNKDILTLRAIYEQENPSDPSLQKMQGETDDEYLVRTGLMDRVTELAKDEVRARAKKEQTKWINEPYRSVVGGGSRTTRGAEAPVVVQKTDQPGVRYSDMKNTMDAFTVTIENAAVLDRIKRNNPDLAKVGVGVGDILVFQPEGSDGYSSGKKVEFTGKWILSESKKKSGGAFGDKNVAVPDAFGKVSFNDGLSSLANSLDGGGEKGRRASYLWWADMTGISLDYNSYDAADKKTIDTFVNKNKKFKGDIPYAISVLSEQGYIK